MTYVFDGEMSYPFIPWEEDPSWRERANCKGAPVSIFFPDKEVGGGRGAAGIAKKRYCADCSVKQECYDFGKYENHGVWGGTSPRDRMGMTRGEERENFKAERRKLFKHGTKKGYLIHIDRGEEPCPYCIAAALDYSTGKRGKDSPESWANEQKNIPYDEDFFGMKSPKGVY